MAIRYVYELIVGALALTMILILGAKGTVFLALLAVIPIIKRLSKTKPDERETQLFFKAGNYTLGGVILFVLLISKFSDTVVNGHKIGDNWMNLLVAGFILLHGIISLWMIKRG